MATFPSEVSRTFSEYLLLPNLTPKSCIPANVSLRTPLVKSSPEQVSSIVLNLPFTSAIMQAVSDHNLAIALARSGGLSFIYASQSIDEQAEMVRKVKNHKAGFVVSDSNLRPEQTIQDAIDLTARSGHSTIAVTDNGLPSGKLLGILTDKDYRPDRLSGSDPVSKYMTVFEDLVCGQEGLTIEEANDIMWRHKKSALPIVDSSQSLLHILFRKDYEDHKKNPDELVDDEKRLRVGAGINTWDYRDRAPALVEAGADVLCVNSSEGYTEWQRDTLEFVKETYSGSVKVGGGNVVWGDGFRYLAEAGADFVKVGIGGGSICITREQKGIGCGQATAVMAVAEARDEYCNESGTYVPICSDGSITQDYHVLLALAMGADFVMLGRYFARFDESPGSVRRLGMNMVKEIWGEGTTRAANWQRYSGEGKPGLMFEEGVDAYVPYAGSLKDNLATTVAKIKSTMCNCGASSLPELRDNARVIPVSQTGLREGGPSNVILKDEQAPY